MEDFENDTEFSFLDQTVEDFLDNIGIEKSVCPNSVTIEKDAFNKIHMSLFSNGESIPRISVTDQKVLFGPGTLVETFSYLPFCYLLTKSGEVWESNEEFVKNHIDVGIGETLLFLEEGKVKISIRSPNSGKDLCYRYFKCLTSIKHNREYSDRGPLILLVLINFEAPRVEIEKYLFKVIHQPENIPNKELEYKDLSKLICVDIF